MRDKLIHDYEGVNTQRVWLTRQTSIPDFLTATAIDPLLPEYHCEYMAASTLNSAQSRRLHKATIGNSQSPEVELLLSCARTAIDLATADTIEALCNIDLDWGRVLELATSSGVSGLLHQSLCDVCPDLVPATALNQLDQTVQACTLNNVFFTQELLKLLQRLEAHQIPALPYKGSALTVLLYGSLALRPFCDVDILIRPSDLVAVKVLLVEAGYDTLEVDDRLESANTWSDTERDFVRGDRRVVLDLHWRITPRFFPFELPVEDLWQRRQSLSLLGVTVPTLAPEDLLLSLCAHGAKECWGKLKWICDVAELIRANPALDWDAVLQRADQFHSRRMVLLGLALASELLNAKLPKTIETLIQGDRVIPVLIPQVYGYLFGTLPPATRRLSPTVFRLWVRDRWQERVQYFIWRVFVPNVRDRRLIVLPQPLSFLYYLIRPLRLVGEKLGLTHRRTLGMEPDDSIKSTGIQGESETTITATNHPRVKPLDVYDLGEELLIYSDEHELGVTLNASSKQIWQLCDGTRSLNDIATAIGQQVGCTRDVLMEDVYTTVMQFYELGLLESL